MRSASALPALLILAACSSSSGEFPDLAVRPIEGRSDAIQAPPPSDAAADPAVAARAAALEAESEAAAPDFDRVLARVEASARAAGPEGSESWVQAQLGLTELDQLRAHTVGALAEIDRLLVTEYAENRPVTAETAAVAAMLQQRSEAQAGAIERIKALLAR